MGLIKYKLGELIESSDLRNRDKNNQYLVDDVKGISTNKEFIETKANLNNVSLGSYKVVEPEYFAYVADTSRRGNKISLAFNDLKKPVIVSSISTVFNVTRRDLLEPYYLFMYFNRPEFDRFSRFNSWGSARETFSWDDFCDIEIEFPSLDIQKKYVAVYEALLANQKAYEEGLEDLKLVCDMYIDDLKNKKEMVAIGNYIRLIDNRNIEGKDFKLKGLSMENYFIDSIANSANLDLSKYKIVSPGEFGCVLMKVGRDARLTIARNDSEESYLISPAYYTFVLENINSDYFMLNVNRSEFERRGWFACDTSARGSLSWDEFCELPIPYANVSEQSLVSKINRVFHARTEVNEKLKDRLKSICPILIKGAMEEASREEVKP